jgi:hypothetical protein
MGKQRAGTLDALARYDAMVAEGHVMPKSLQTMAENLRNNSYAKDAKQVFKSKQLDEYVAAVNRFLARGGTTRQIIEKVGVIQSEDGTDILKLARRGGAKTDENPFGLSLRGSREGTNTNLNRKLNEEVPLKYRSHFKNDADWKRYKKYIKQGNVSNEKLTPKGFHKGHTTSISIVEASHDPLAQRLESATGNMSTGAKYDIPRERLQAAGTPTTWEESIDQFKNPRKYKKFRILTPQDKQRIYNGANPDDVFSQRKAAISANPLASGKRGNIRTNVRLNHPGKNLDLKILGGLPNNLLKIARNVPKIGAGLTLLSIIGDSVQAAQTTEEIEQEGFKDKHIADIASIAMGAGSFVVPPLAVGSAITGVSGMVMRDRDRRKALLQEQLNNPNKWMWNKENTQLVPIPQSGGNFSHSDENPVIISKTEPQPSTADNIGDTIHAWAKDPLNEIKYGYQQLLNFTKHFR